MTIIRFKISRLLILNNASLAETIEKSLSNRLLLEYLACYDRNCDLKRDSEDS